MTTKAKVIPLKPPSAQFEDLSEEDANELILGLYVIYKTIDSRRKALELARSWFAGQGVRLVRNSTLPNAIQETVQHLRYQKKKGQYVVRWRSGGYQVFNTLAEVAEALHLGLYQLRNDFVGQTKIDLAGITDEHGNPEIVTLELVPFDQLTEHLRLLELEDAQG
jgi:hypothetical protein